MNHLRKRLNELERRHPLAYAITLIVACDAFLAAVLFIARPIA